MLNVLIQNLAKYLFASSKDLLPIILVVFFFQVLVISQPLPDVYHLLTGVLWTLLGLSLFVYGLELALFPIGESLAYTFVHQGRLWALLLFSAFLGFGTTVAEPALIAVSNKAAQIAQLGNIIDNNATALTYYANGLRYSVALSVAFAVILGVMRIIKGWSLVGMITILYMLVIIMTIVAIGLDAQFIIGIAYDIGGVTTSTITVPLITALGVGLASSIAGRSPMKDGFGMIAIAAVVPIIAVLLFGIAQ